MLELFPGLPVLVTGIGTVLATIKEKQMNPGPGCNGAAIMGGVEVYEKVLE